MRLLALCFFQFIFVSIVAQRDFIFTNSQVVDTKRYDEIKGDPMVFSDWMLANIIDVDDNTYERVYVNYNSHAEAFEVKKSDAEFIILSPEMYTDVVIIDPRAKKEMELDFLDNLIFKKAIHPKMKNKFVLSIFEGKGYQLLKYFNTDIITTTKNIPGEIVELNRFNKKDIMILFDHGKKIEFQMKKKSIKNNLPLYFDVKRYKKKKPSIYTYEGLVNRIKEIIIAEKK